MKARRESQGLPNMKCLPSARRSSINAWSHQTRDDASSPSANPLALCDRKATTSGRFAASEHYRPHIPHLHEREVQKEFSCGLCSSKPPPIPYCSSRLIPG